MVSMNRLTIERRAQIIGSLVEGNSIRATARMTGAAKGETISMVTPEVRVKWLRVSAGFGVQVPITGPRDFDIRPLLDVVYEYSF